MSKQGPTRDAYTTAGRTRDGVRLLEPEVGPKHFSREQIRRTIEKVVGQRATTTGKFEKSR